MRGSSAFSHPVILETPYRVFVPKIDADGNDIAGIRLPDISVPLATYTGYAYRAPASWRPQQSESPQTTRVCRFRNGIRTTQPNVNLVPSTEGDTILVAMAATNKCIFPELAAVPVAFLHSPQLRG
jgi:hypothetical protein